MGPIKEKIPAFLLGITTGLIIAISFFIFKLDDYFEKLKLYKHITETIYTYTQQQKEKQREELRNKEYEKQQQITDSKPRKNTESENAKTSLLAQEIKKERKMRDSVFLKAIENDEDFEEVIVERDKLLMSLPFQIINLNAISAAEKMTDSLLQKVSGVKDDRNAEKYFITVEQWKSPLNYKGYKMSKNKLILYGLQSIEGIKLYKLDGIFYAKLPTSIVYKLEQTYDYKPYQQVQDEGVLNKLK
jgi:hypothetical protein